MRVFSDVRLQVHSFDQGVHACAFVRGRIRSKRLEYPKHDMQGPCNSSGAVLDITVGRKCEKTDAARPNHYQNEGAAIYACMDPMRVSCREWAMGKSTTTVHHLSI